MRRRLSVENSNNGTQNNTNVVMANKLAIAWVDLKFYGLTILNKKTKIILNDISGSIDFGTLNALMGPSGAGKSTLLKCINGRQSDGIDSNSNFYLSIKTNVKSCFIVQDISEHLLRGLTSMQSLIYASKIKNLEEECDHEINAKKLLSDLMISDIEDTVVEKCSGGEQKRLAIALELTAVRKPNLLCIDEPTSGLDSNAAEIVIQCLKDVSRKHNIAIVTSIHQPNNDVLMLFDKLYVLAKRGICVYEGPPHQLRNHLSSALFECHEYQVPIEVLLKIASKYDESVNRLVDINNKNKVELQYKCMSEGRLVHNGVPLKKSRFKWKHFWYLLNRTATYSFGSQWRSMVIQFLFFVGLGFLVTQLYNKHIGEPDGCFTFEATANISCVKTVEALKEESFLSQNLRLQFFVTILIQFLTTVATTLVFTTEVRIFFNEHKNGWYSSGSYYWAKTMVELPLCLLITVCYVLIVYKFNNQINEQYRLFGYLCSVTAGVLCSQGLGFTIGIIANSNDKLAIVLAVGGYLINLMLCGFFAPITELPEAIQWITNVSFVKQTYEIMLYLIYGFNRCPKEMISSILYQMNITEQNKFVMNSIILVIQVINYRFLPLFVLLIKANPISIRFPKRIDNKKNISVEPIEQIIEM